MSCKRSLFRIEISLSLVLCFWLNAIFLSRGAGAAGSHKDGSSKLILNLHRAFIVKVSPSATDWSDYFNYVIENKAEVEEFPYFLSFLAKWMSSPQQLKLAIANLDLDQIEKLPREFKWVITSVKGHLGLSSPEAQEDAKVALRSIQLTETINFFTFRRNMSSELQYERFPAAKKADQRMDRLAFLHSKHLFYFYQGLHLVLSNVSNEIRTSEINELQLNWVYFLKNLLRDLVPGELLDVISIFKNLGPRSFSSQEQYDLFLNRMIQLSMEYGSRWGQYALNDQGTTYYIVQGPRRNEYEQIRSSIRHWVLKSLPYAVVNYDYLRRRELLDLKELLAIPFEESDLRYLRMRIEKKDLTADSYLVACLAWLAASHSARAKITVNATFEEKLTSENGAVGVGSIREVSSFDRTTQIAIESLAVMAVNSKVAISKSILIAIPGIDSLQVFEYGYLGWTEIFYRYMNQLKYKIDPKTLSIISSGRTLRTPEIQIPQWQRLDWQRLEILWSQMSEVEFFNMTWRVLNRKSPSDIDEKIIYAKFFQEHASAELSKSMVAKLKLEFKPKLAMPWRNFSLKSEHWNDNDGYLIRLVFALDTQDAELQSFLAKIYLERRYDTAVSGQMALGMLEIMKVKSAVIHNELIRSLSNVHAGDSFGAFRVLLSLFPDSGSDILEIVFKQRIEVEKRLSPMLTILVQMAAENPIILTSLQEAVKNRRQSIAAQSRYQGVTLDRWVEMKLERNKISLGGKCASLFN